MAKRKKAAKARSRRRAAKSLAIGASTAASADGIEALLVANAQALGLPIDPAWQAGIKFNLDLTLRLARLIDGFPLPDDIEPGGVFRA